MRTVKSPGGSIYPYHYKDGEIHCLKYGSFFQNHAALFDLFKAEEDFIRNTKRRLRIWVDFYETNISEEVLTKFLASINRINDHILKISIVGLSFFDIWRLNRLSKKLGISSNCSIRYYKDPEDAKTWLVSE
ncbi:hypothetical protein [Paenibacillus solani]|uniref:hypothetical protein n=1 Tax=Paenibacillus solani TaxID=1705565 RepID=UPI003D27D6FE